MGGPVTAEYMYDIQRVSHFCCVFLRNRPVYFSDVPFPEPAVQRQAPFLSGRRKNLLCLPVQHPVCCRPALCGKSIGGGITALCRVAGHSELLLPRGDAVCAEADPRENGAAPYAGPYCRGRTDR